MSDLSIIHNKIHRSINANFKNVIKIEGNIAAINVNRNYFVVKSDDDKYMECRVDGDLSNIKINDSVSIEGRISVDTENSGKIYIMVTKLHHRPPQYNDFIKLYNQLFVALHKDNFQKRIQKITQINPPQYIKNIAVIVPPDNENNILNFKKEFENKCVGNLFVYHLRKNEILRTLEEALEYFKKYHNIDMICLLANELSQSSHCDLSSKYIIKYMLLRKDFPYIATIIQLPHIAREPLIAILSNNKYYGITNCIDYISQNQNSFRKTIEENIILGKKVMTNNIDNYRNKILKLKMCIADYDDPSFKPQIKTNNALVENLKYLMLRKLEKERKFLHHMKEMITKHLIGDIRFKLYLSQYIAHKNENIEHGKNNGRTININHVYHDNNKEKLFTNENNIQRIADDQITIVNGSNHNPELNTTQNDENKPIGVPSSNNDEKIENKNTNTNNCSPSILNINISHNGDI